MRTSKNWFDITSLAYIAILFCGILVFQEYKIIGILLSASGFFGIIMVKSQKTREFVLFKKIDRLISDSEEVDTISKITVSIYFIIWLVFLIWGKVMIKPDHMIFIGLVGATLIRRTRGFLTDWLPFILLIYSYDLLRGFADDISLRVVYNLPITIDEILFGTLPTISLQKMFYTPGICSVIDWGSIFFYSTHFISLMGFGVILWVNNQDRFRVYRDTILVVSYAALITFILLPVAPPWIASHEGYISKLDVVGKECGRYSDLFFTMYATLNSNKVAAIPSLHIAYPWIIFLFSKRFFGKMGMISIMLPAGVGFSTIYLGHHYVVDLLAGIIYAQVAFYISCRFRKC